MIYRWNANTSRPGIDAQTVGEELERIRVYNNGRLEPSLVVDAARPPDAALHDAFEWDDAKAAEAHRADQARYIIRHIEVVIDKAEGDPTPVRAFVSVKRDEDRSYTAVTDALSDPTLRAQVLAGALKELEAWRHRYAELLELAKVFAVIDQARSA